MPTHEPRVILSVMVRGIVHTSYCPICCRIIKNIPFELHVTTGRRHPQRPKYMASLVVTQVDGCNHTDILWVFLNAIMLCVIACIIHSNISTAYNAYYSCPGTFLTPQPTSRYHLESCPIYLDMEQRFTCFFYRPDWSHDGDAFTFRAPQLHLR